MKHLWILRHGKAADGGPHLADVQRPLAHAGREQAKAVGGFLRERYVQLDRAICSSALRTRETTEIALEAGQFRVPLDRTDRLYEAAGTDLLEYLQELKDLETSVLLVGHMPGIGELLSVLVTDKDDLSMVFKPGTLALVTLDVEHWSKLGKGKGELALLMPATPGH